jgi:hypothetical protein
METLEAPVASVISRLCLTRNLYSSEKFDISASVGGKIPSNKSNLRSEENGLMFPMYYQTSLGTYDAIAGISFINKKWLFATGIQHPFNQNENVFTWGAWIPVYEGGEDYVRQNMIAYKLKRGTDVMLRAERNFAMPDLILRLVYSLSFA